LFRDCGPIRDIDIRKGYAFVRMEDERGAKRVLNYDSHKVMGRPIKIKIRENRDTLENHQLDKSHKNPESEERKRDKYSRD